MPVSFLTLDMIYDAGHADRRQGWKLQTTW
ncbi:hypothetical protein QC762_0037290 [Podospora pseudocomata]|uniref:Uncharacterized protein n=1 Tax=Podospora pseudocomata TaxID=2093779 RepID=A0ABR0GLQ2_9PEZI|nr:hypothetical protein QC762_0037290 [Podospora pseudocomata]